MGQWSTDTTTIGGRPTTADRVFSGDSLLLVQFLAVRASSNVVGLHEVEVFGDVIPAFREGFVESVDVAAVIAVEANQREDARAEYDSEVRGLVESLNTASLGVG